MTTAGITITSNAGTFDYTLGVDFNNGHVAQDLASAKKLAWRRYDESHEDTHRVAVTVIVRGSLAGAVATELDARRPYNWSLTLEGVNAVTVGPSGRSGINGDVGQEETTDAVVVSGYAAGGIRRITHVAASQ